MAGQQPRLHDRRSRGSFSRHRQSSLGEPMFAGSMVALVTPFKDGKIDWQSLEALVEFHIKNGTNGIVPCGTTGESATLDHREHHEIVERVIKAVNKRVPVIAGTGSKSPPEVVG